MSILIHHMFRYISSVTDHLNICIAISHNLRAKLRHVSTGMTQYAFHAQFINILQNEDKGKEDDEIDLALGPE